jgi:hypothetical protein
MVPAETVKKLDLDYLKDLKMAQPLSSLLSGEAAFAALKQAIDNVVSVAQKDCDVVIQAFKLVVTEVRYIKPHTLLFKGFTDNGHEAVAVCHFSQLVAHIVYLPKRGESRIITGFNPNSAA